MSKKMQVYVNEFIEMIQLLGKRKWIYLIGLILSCAANAGQIIVFDLGNKFMIDAGVYKKEILMINATILLIIAFSAAIVVFPIMSYIKELNMKLGIKDIKLRLFRKIECLQSAYLDEHHSGEFVSLITNDVNVVEDALGLYLQMVTYFLFNGIGSAVVMFLLDWRLSLISVIFGVISVSINARFIKGLRYIGDEKQEIMSRITQNLSDLLKGLKVVKIFNIGSIITNKVLSENSKSYDMCTKSSKINAQMNSINSLFTIINSIGIFVIGIFMISAGSISLGTVTAIVMLQGSVSMMFRQLGTFFAQLQQSLSGVSRICSFLNQSTEKIECMDNEKKELKKLEEDDYSIRFDKVFFSYDKQDEIINNLNLDINSNKSVALVGESGSGKSTILKLIMRLYDIQNGNISICGRNIKEFTLGDLRKLIAYVPQDSYLFNGTIEENIRYGKLSATRDEIISAAKAANAYNFILELPDGFNTMVGDNGSNLSGGQKQRITIARAFLKDAPFLLLDEPTSSLDLESESIVQNALISLMKGRTTIVVAHRMTTIRNVDIICVMKNGTVVERGSHDKLINNNGYYKKFYTLQTNNNLSTNNKTSYKLSTNIVE